MTEMRFPLRGRRVWVAGETGMVGSAIGRRLAREDCVILSAPHAALDLKDGAATRHWLLDQRPDVIFVAAARVGGIAVNDSQPVPFLADNLAIAASVIEGAHDARVAKLLFLGSSCIYPRLAPQPIPESALMTGSLEPTNQWYAMAKLAGIKLCQAYRRQFGSDFITCLPTNLYGPGDNFDLETSHVMPALMRKAHEAKKRGGLELTIWGSGTPRREFLHVDDCADACLHLMKHYSAEIPVNVGAGEDIPIADLARLICDIVGFKGRIVQDTSRPDGMPRKLLDVSRLTELGWRPRIGLRDGLEQTYAWFLENVA